MPACGGACRSSAAPITSITITITILNLCLACNPSVGRARVRLLRGPRLANGATNTRIIINNNIIVVVVVIIVIVIININNNNRARHVPGRWGCID